MMFRTPDDFASRLAHGRDTPSAAATCAILMPWATLCLLLITTGASGANIISYTDRAAFTADVGSRVQVDFEDARQCGVFSENFNPVNLRGITFAGGANRGTSSGACPLWSEIDLQEADTLQTVVVQP